MKIYQILFSLCALQLISTNAWSVSPVEEILQEYRQQGASNFSAESGRALWGREYFPADAVEGRRCASCHTLDVRQMGKHVITGKEIKPLAPSVNTNRLTNIAKIKKWLERNCTWTLGRSCTAQEKGDVLSYLKDQ